MSEHILTVNGVDFNADIKKDIGVIEVTNVFGKTVAIAQLFDDTENGVYTIFDDSDDLSEDDLPRDCHDNMVDGDGLDAAKWLCAQTFQ